MLNWPSPESMRPTDVSRGIDGYVKMTTRIAPRTIRRISGHHVAARASREGGVEIGVDTSFERVFGNCRKYSNCAVAGPVGLDKMLAPSHAAPASRCALRQSRRIGRG